MNWIASHNTIFYSILRTDYWQQRIEVKIRKGKIALKRLLTRQGICELLSDV